MIDLAPLEERWILARLQRQPWREVMAAALAQAHPELYARVSDPGPAAVVSLLDLPAGARCLDATGGWGELAIPLAGTARVVALAPSATRAAILRAIAVQEGAAVEVVAACAATPFKAASFDALLLHDVPATAAPALRQAAQLLRPGGTLYLSAANELARLMTGAAGAAAPRTLAFYEALFAESGLAVAAAYACFPHHTQPRWFVPLGLVDDFIVAHAADAPPGGGPAAAYAGLAAERIARHFAPSFAFILRREAARARRAGRRPFRRPPPVR